MPHSDHYAQMQSYICSRTDCARVLSLDRETISSPTSPLIHQEARFLYVLSGRGTIRIQGRSIPLSRDTLLSILPWQITEVTAVDEPLQYYLLVYNIELLNRFIQSFRDIDGDCARLISHMESTPGLYLTAPQAETVRAYFESLREEIGLESTLSRPAQRPMAALWVVNRAVELVILAERIYVENTCGLSCGEAKEDGLQGLLRYLYLHAGEKLTAGALSEVFRVPQAAVRAYIKSVTGRGFQELLHEMRIGKISGFLLYTDLTLDEIACLTGYTDAPHLSRIFSEMTGMRISDYRKAYRTADSVCRMEHAELAYSIAQHVYRRYSEPLSISDVARQFGVSPAEVNRLLISQVEKNFAELLNFVRVNMASRLILSTNWPLIDISLEVGYTNVKTFNRNFMRWRGMTPGEFRKTVALQASRLTDDEEGAHAGANL